MKQSGAGGLLVLLAVTAHTRAQAYAVADTSKGGPLVSLRGGSVTKFFRQVSPPSSMGSRALSYTHIIILYMYYNNMT